MAVRLSELEARRSRVLDRAQTLVDRAQDEGRVFTAAEKRQYDELSAELDQIDGRVNDRVGPARSAKLEQRFRDAIVNRDSAAIDIFPLRRRSYYQPGVEARALTKGTATQALPSTAYERIMMHLVESSAVLSAGATVINTATGEDMPIGKSTALSAAALPAEGAAPALSDPTLGVSTLKAWGYKAEFQVTTELATDSESDLLGFLEEQAGQALAVAFGPHLITGTGTGQPRGIVTDATVGVTGPTGTATSLGAQATAGQGTDLLHSLIASVADPYTRRPAAGFMMANASEAICHKLKATDGTTLPGNQGHEVVGYPNYVDPSVAAMAANAKSIIFGDFSRYVVRIAGGIRFERSDQFAFNADLVTFKAVIRLDGALVDANGLKTFQNSAT